MFGLGVQLPRRGLLYALAATLILACLVTFRPDQRLGPLYYRTTDCSSLHGIEDIFIVVKTGACEVRKKFPVHLHTTLQCTSSWAVLSDLKETVRGVPIHDAFNGDVKEEYLNGIDEFALYKKLGEVGSCDKLTPQDLQAADTTPGNNGNFKNRGWNLDKWKYLPMVDRAWRMKPNSTWYLIIETDTLIIWPNLLRWMEGFNVAKDHYIGSQMQIGDQLFAYGGGGTLVSNSAMQKVSQHYEANRTSLEAFTKSHWAGDCVFGKALQDVGVKLMWSWPHILTESLGGLDFNSENYGMRLWCSPVITYHHMTPEALVDFWKFQAAWFEANPTSLLRHKDVFVSYVMPRIAAPKDNWDNLSHDKPDQKPEPTNAEQCMQACIVHPECVQYSFGKEGCRTSKVVKLGQAPENPDDHVHSGWITDRVERFIKAIKKCSDHHMEWRRDFYGY